MEPQNGRRLNSGEILARLSGLAVLGALILGAEPSAVQSKGEPGVQGTFRDGSQMLCSRLPGGDLYVAPPNSASPSGPTNCDVPIDRDLLKQVRVNGRVVRIGSLPEEVNLEDLIP